MPWEHSMDGVPWTPRKMRSAVQVLRKGASLGFAFGADPLEKLHELDAKVLAKRPDLRLHVWSTHGNRRIAEDELRALGSLRHVRALEVSGFKNGTLDEVGALSKLEELVIRGRIENLDVVAKLPALRSMWMSGAVSDLSPLGACKRIERLLVSFSEVRSLDFLSVLPKLTELRIDSATIACSLDPIAKVRKLDKLGITANKKLEDVAFFAGLSTVRELVIAQPRLTKLPVLSRLSRLTTIQLDAMTSWKNPEVLETLPAVRSIVLREINPKLPAESFFFLTKKKGLRSVDIRWIDFAKRRREALEKWFADQEKTALLVRSKEA